MTGQRDNGMEIGLLAGLLLLNVLFQFIPAGDLGRLSTRTFDNSMEAVEAFFPYDATVEEKQQEIFQETLEIQQQVEETAEEISQELIISFSDDTVGLSSVSTVEMGTGSAANGTDEIGPPVFQPVEVFPACIFMPPPEYPEMARMAGVEGTVTLWVYVDANGVVQGTLIMQGSGVNSLDDAALAAAFNTRWSPARNNGETTGVWTTLRYDFRLSE